MLLQRCRRAWRGSYEDGRPIPSRTCLRKRNRFRKIEDAKPRKKEPKIRTARRQLVQTTQTRALFLGPVLSDVAKSSSTTERSRKTVGNSPAKNKDVVPSVTLHVNSQALLFNSPPAPSSRTQLVFCPVFTFIFISHPESPPPAFIGSPFALSRGPLEQVKNETRRRPGGSCKSNQRRRLSKLAQRDAPYIRPARWPRE